MTGVSRTMLGAVAALALSLPLAGALAQEGSGRLGAPLTVEEALQPDGDMLDEAIRLVPENAELFVDLSAQIAQVEAVDVSDITDDSPTVAEALDQVGPQLELFRAALADSEPVTEAMEAAEISAEDVVAAQVIQGDVVSVVLYYVR